MTRKRFMENVRCPLPRCRYPLATFATAAFLGSVSAPVLAIDINTGNSDLSVRWENTLKYSAMWRTSGQSRELISEYNQDDGNRNFSRGLVSNRLDVLSELDVVYKRDFGFRLSGAAWYDDVYNQSTDNNSPLTNNALSVGHRDFTRSTERLHGREAEILDAFIMGRFDVADMPLTIRAGQHSIVFGETLFFGANGIAAAQGPTDVVKALSVPNTQFKEILRPVKQLSTQLQINSQFTLDAYYQFEWQETRLPGAGSYFSTFDGIGDGAETLFVAPGVYFNRYGDIEASNQGQGGVQLSWRPSQSDTEYGFYAVKYHDKTPQFYLYPSAGSYRLVYPEDIKAYGASFSTVFGDANIAGELSYRTDMPLATPAQVDVAGTGDNNSNPLYAVGRTAHFNTSAIYVMNGTALFDSATLMAELGWNRLLKVTENRQALDPGAKRDAWGFRFVFEPSYYQPVPGWDFSVPFGLGYNPEGRSAAVGGFNGGAHEGGDFNIGVKGRYKNNLLVSVSYTNYFGSTKTLLRDTGNGYVLNFGQPLADRDNISLSAQYNF